MVREAEMKKTEWFPYEIKPRREGVYERQYNWGTDFAYFGPMGWGVAGESPKEAYNFRNFISGWTGPWRGLLEST